MSFLIKDDALLENCNNILDQVRNSIKRGHNSEPSYNEKCLLIKIKYFEEKIKTSFDGDKIPKQGSHCVCA